MENEKDIITPTPDDICDADFAYVQQDKSIHDTKFETKPTTFFKDALKRFAKNKSSVIAAGILATVIGMAIIVPLANGNNISDVIPSNDAHYLPPKWWGNAGGFLDGTKWIDGAIVDPSTGLPDESQYKSRAIVRGEGQDVKDAISIKDSRVEGVTETILKYGQGGNVTVSVSAEADDGTYIGEPTRVESPTFAYVKGDALTLDYAFDQALFLDRAQEDTTLYATLLLESDFDGDGEKETYTLKEETDARELSAWRVSFLDDLPSDALAKINDNLEAESFDAKVVLEISAKEIKDAANRFYLSSVQGKAEKTNLEDVVFADAVAEVRREANKDLPASRKYAYSKAAERTLSNVLAQTASFRYDYYEAAYGEEEMEISNDQLKVYIDRGFLSWNWDDKKTTTDHTWQKADPSMYQIFDLEHSPIREIKEFKNMKKSSSIAGDVEIRTLKCTVSLYRYYWVDGKLGSCAMPHMIFGTNQNGQDFFKIVFSGLLTSLGLGLLSAVINIFIGLVWGAISGYFGGWTDLIMERFMEILGGMPWIVLMTLIVLLLGSGFWTLLLALCLTGWMGVAGMTRSQFYRFKGREYVLASRTLGASDARLIFKHILPNGIGTIVTGAVLMIPSVIFTEANVAYLLPGILQYQNGIVSFGITLSEAQKSLQDHPYLIVSASLVMVLIMIAFNLFGNGLRDAFNPSLKGADE